MSEKRCQQCHAEMPTFSPQEITEKLRVLSDWQYNENQNCIYKTFQFKGFYKTMAFVNAVAWIAQQEGHHPDMQISYNRATIAYQTHEAKGITENDFICAEKIEALNSE
jgi:4a-hydroxytetrahydrobiopterin dehydratase